MSFFADALRSAPWRQEEGPDAPERVRLDISQDQAKFLLEVSQRKDCGIIEEFPNGTVIVWSAATSYGNRAVLQPDPGSPYGFVHAEDCRSTKCRHILLYWQSKGAIVAYQGTASGMTIIEKAARRHATKAQASPKVIKPETFGLKPAEVATAPALPSPEVPPETTEPDDSAEDEPGNEPEIVPARRPQSKAVSPRRGPPMPGGPVVINVEPPISLHILRPDRGLLLIKGLSGTTLGQGVAHAERLGFGARDAPLIEAAKVESSDALDRLQPPAVVQAILLAGSPVSRWEILARLFPAWPTLCKAEQMQAYNRLGNIIDSQKSPNGRIHGALADVGAVKIAISRQKDTRRTAYQLVDACGEVLCARPVAQGVPS